MRVIPLLYGNVLIGTASLVHRPILDDTITTNEVNESIKNLKRRGCDYPLSIVYMIKSMYLPMLLLLLQSNISIPFSAQSPFCLQYQYFM